MTTDWPELVEIPEKYDDRKPTDHCVGRPIQIPNSITPLVDLDEVLEANHTNLVEDKDLLVRES